MRAATSNYRFAELIRSQMDKLGITRGALAETVGRSVEHVRKLEAGEAFPSKDLEHKLVGALHLNPADFAEAVEKDRWFKKFGKRPPQGAPSSPIEKYWDNLTSEQRKSVLCVVECFTRFNKSRIRK